MPVENGCGGDHLGHRDNPGAADTRDPEGESVVDTFGGGRCRHYVGVDVRHRVANPSGLAGGDRDKRRAIAFEAGEVEIARTLIDPGLATELRRHRMHRQAIRLLAAVAAPLADPLVDHHACGGSRLLTALAPATLLGGAVLIVDEHSDALDGRELLLDLHQIIATAHLDSGR